MATENRFSLLRQISAVFSTFSVNIQWLRWFPQCRDTAAISESFRQSNASVVKLNISHAKIQLSDYWRFQLLAYILRPLNPADNRQSDKLCKSTTIKIVMQHLLLISSRTVKLAEIVMQHLLIPNFLQNRETHQSTELELLKQSITDAQDDKDTLNKLRWGTSGLSYTIIIVVWSGELWCRLL